MPKFSSDSISKLKTCDPRLSSLFNNVIPFYDCIVLPNGGARTPELQETLVAEGASKKLNSKHVVTIEKPLSRAVDVAPYPVIWPDKNSPYYIQQYGRFYHFAGYVKKVAETVKLRIRYGGDWDSDLDFMDQTFNDLVHFELIEEV